MSWDDVINRGESDSVDLRIMPNTTVVVHALIDQGEEPTSYWTHYIPNKGKGVKGFVAICPGKEICPACRNKEYRTKRQHAINVWDFKSNSVKILEQGNQVMSQLKLIHDQLGSFNNIDLSIRRIGEGKGTQYVVVPIPRQEPFKEVYKKHNISQLKQPHSVKQINSFICGFDSQDTSFDTQKMEEEEGSTSSSYTNQVVGAGTGNKNESGVVMPFGKYKGQTLEEIVSIDMNYVKWCADNITDQNIKQRAQELCKSAIPNKPEQSTARGQMDTAGLINLIQTRVDTDPRYKGNFSLIVEKLKNASKSPTYPNGKTLLAEFSIEELNRLLFSL